MTSLAFVMPAHGRLPLAAICMRQLRRTCDTLAENGIHASGVVIGDDANLDTAADLGFATVRRDNRFLSRKYNDGIQAACDPAWNPNPADYVVPIGSDDFVHPGLFLDLPPADTVLGFQHMSFVREDGREMVSRFLNYPGGCGIRVYPRQVMEALSFRPADEDRERGCDTSILVNLQRRLDGTLKLWHPATDPRWIVDWKSRGEQVTTYENLTRHRETGVSDPFAALADVFPNVALDEMAAHYGVRELAAA